MLVALNVELAYSHPTGMGTYARELVAAFKAKDRGVEFLALRTRQARDEADNAPGSPEWWKPETLPYSRKILTLSTLVGVALPTRFSPCDVDVYHDFASARLLPVSPYIVTVHDAAVVEHPRAYAWHSRALLRLQLPSIRRAAAVVTVSLAAKSSLVDKLGLCEERVHVIHNGVSNAFFPRPAPDDGPDYVNPARIAPYLLFIGIDNARKNLGTLLRAFRLHVDRHPHSDLRLMIVGPTGIGAEARPDQISSLGLADRVDRLGHVPISALHELLWGAEALFFPSVSEGFGLPVLEAMASGCLVVCSDIPVLREVGGEAVSYVEPLSIDAWSAAIGQTLSGAERAERIKRGLERACLFSWSAAADAICRIYSSVGAR